MAAGDGLISMAPTSIAYSGTSASINADGGVDFSAVTSLSLNGVFTGDYDNYLIVFNYVGTGTNNVSWKLRASGTDTTGSDYTRQYIYASDTNALGDRVTSQSSMVIGRTSTGYGGDHIHVYGPALAQPTAVRSVNASAISGASIETDNAHTHSLSTSYDGFTLSPVAGSVTGNVHVFGYEE